MFSPLRMLRPQYGLYGAAVAPLFYGILGRSGQLSIAASAITSLLVAEALTPFVSSENPTYVHAAVTLALTSGLLQSVFALFRFGGLLSQFLSHTLISAFTSAAASIIMLLQLKHILQISVPRGGLLEIVPEVIANVADANVSAVVMSVVCAAFLLAFKKFLPTVKRFPVQLFVVIVATSATVLFDLDASTSPLKTIGSVPASLPTPAIPRSPFHSSFADHVGLTASIFRGALVVALISYIESISIGQVFRQKNNESPLAPNQELWALGMTNVAASFFVSFPVTGGFSRSAINASAGAKTPVAGAVAAVVVIAALTFLTPLFSRIPNSALGTIVLVAASSLVDFGLPKKLYAVRATQWGDLAVWAVTFVVTIMINVEIGVIAGISASFVVIVARLLKTDVAVLGRYGEGQFRDVARKGAGARVYEGVAILRWGGDLLSFNVAKFARRVEAEGGEGAVIVLDMSCVNFIDSDGLGELVKIHERVEGVLVSACRAPVRDALLDGGVFEKMGKEAFFETTAEAVDAARRAVEAGGVTEAMVLVEGMEHVL